MFVRLFVDENLDRHVPISKQPKEKIQVLAHFKYANQLNIDMGELRNGSKWSSYTSCM